MSHAPIFLNHDQVIKIGGSPVIRTIKAVAKCLQYALICWSCIA